MVRLRENRYAFNQHKTARQRNNRAGGPGGEKAYTHSVAIKRHKCRIDPVSCHLLKLEVTKIGPGT